MSQTFPQSLSRLPDSYGVSLSFAKFSHVTSAVGARSFAWNHVSARSDLTFVLRDTTSMHAYGPDSLQIQMTISAGTEILESHDLADVLRVAQKHVASDLEAPVQVVTKCPFLAMRYPKTTNTVRRFQVKFHNAGDFARVVDIMRALGIPVTNSGGITGPETRSQKPPRPGNFMSTALDIPSAMSPPLPLAQQTYSDRIKPRAQPMKTSSPYLPEEQVTRCSSSLGSEIRRANSSIGSNPPISELSRSFPSPKMIHKGPDYHQGISRYDGSKLMSESEEPNGVGRMRTSQVKMSPSYLNTTSTSHSVIHGTNSDDCFLKPSSPLSNFDAGDRFRLKRTIDAIPNEHRPGDPKLIQSKRNALNFERKTDGSQRPASTPIGINEKFWMLPNRTLSFSNPRDGRNSRFYDVSALPPLPKPTPVLTHHPTSDEMNGRATIENPTSAQIHRHASNLTFQRKNPSPQASFTQEAAADVVERADALNDSVSKPVVAETTSPLVAKGDTLDASDLTPSLSPLHTKPAASKKRPILRPSARSGSHAKKRKMVDSSTQTQTLSGRDHTSAMRSIQHNQVIQPVEVANQIESPPSAILDQLDAFISKHKSRPAPTELWQAPGYTAGNDEQRLALLNNFICDNLENEDFLKLCEDTEKAWRRIGLVM